MGGEAFQGVAEGVFRESHMLYVESYFCMSQVFQVCGWSSPGKHRRFDIHKRFQSRAPRNTREKLMGPPFDGSRSSREIELQNASCQMGGREVTR